MKKNLLKITAYSSIIITIGLLIYGIWNIDYLIIGVLFLNVTAFNYAVMIKNESTYKVLIHDNGVLKQRLNDIKSNQNNTINTQLDGINKILNEYLKDKVLQDNLLKEFSIIIPKLMRESMKFPTGNTRRV